MKQLKLRISIMLLIGIDLVSKYVFYTLEYVKGIVRIHPVFNLGISRSLPMPFAIIIGMSFIGIGVFIFLFIKKKIPRWIAAFLIAGTAGNLIDRLWLGGVRDFINIKLFNFPIFNLADVMLTIGVMLRIFIVMLEKKK